MYDLIVIGSGPGGYVAAIRASQLGMKVAIIEKRSTLGGTCLNVGCIPSKALLDSSHKYEELMHGYAEHGISVEKVSLDLSQLMKRKEQVVSDVTKGVAFLMKKNKIDVHEGTGKLLKREGDLHRVEVVMSAGEKAILESKNVLLATGSVPAVIPGMEPDGKTIITSDEAIALKKVPEHFIIIGAGVIGLELGSVYSRLGAKVSVVEMLPSLFPGLDTQVSSLAKRTLEKQGLKFYFSHKVESVKKTKSGVALEAKSQKDEKLSLEGDVLLVAAGRKPYTEGLGLEDAGVTKDARGFVSIDDHFRTNIEGVYAIGDIVRGPMLAHKAEDEGIAVAEILAGQKSHVNYQAVPFVVYTHPEIAWVGESEESLKEKGIPVKTGKSFYKANGRARAMEISDGMVKVIAHAETDEVLGVAILGEAASELIQEVALGVEYRAASEDIGRTMHAHPTLSEVVRDAAQAVTGWAIHQ